MWIPVQIHHPSMLRIEHPPPQPVGRGSRSVRCGDRMDLLQADLLCVGLYSRQLDVDSGPDAASVDVDDGTSPSTAS